jgi:hypothetical protein
VEAPQGRGAVVRSEAGALILLPSPIQNQHLPTFARACLKRDEQRLIYGMRAFLAEHLGKGAP